MNFKKMLFSFLLSITTAQTVQSMFTETQPSEDPIFNLIKNANVEELKIYLEYLNQTAQTSTTQGPAPVDTIKNHLGKTPLQIATEQYNFNYRKSNRTTFQKIIEILLSYNAHPDFCYYKTKSPRELNDTVFTTLGY